MPKSVPFTKVEEDDDSVRDNLASVRDILYEDTESNEIETDGPAYKR